jgi:hypothetical protein
MAMPDSIPDKTPAPADVPQADLSRTPQPQKPSIGSASGPLGQSIDKSGSTSLPHGYLADQLEDAERLLEYAAEVGIDVDTKVRDDVLNARIASHGGLSGPAAANLLSALTQLVAHTRPVTAESLKACAHPERVQSVFRFYQKVAIGLAILIVPWSLATAISTEMSEAIRKDLDTANALAVKLSDELGPPQTTQAPVKTKGRADALPHGVSEKDVIRDLQQFAGTIRAIYARARQLNFFTAFTVADPFARDKPDWAETKKTFGLPEGLPNLSLAAT